MPMKKSPRLMIVALWGLMLVAVLALLAPAMWQRWHGPPIAESPAELVPPAPVPDFTLTDQNGRTFTSADLKGRVWIADFIFTRCNGPCPIMTGKMAGMQKPLSGANVQLVSFSVDPTFDTPEVLKQYAAAHGADSKQWTLLTGPKAAIQGVARSMYIGAAPAIADQPMAHATYFVLVDANGMIRGHYGNEDLDSVQRIVADALKLARGSRAP